MTCHRCTNLEALTPHGIACRLDDATLYVPVRRDRRAVVDLTTGAWTASIQIDGEWVEHVSGTTSVDKALSAAWDAAEQINEDDVRDSLQGGRENCDRCGGAGCGACAFTRKAA